MTKDFLNKIKTKLKQEKQSLEQELQRFAKKDLKVKEDWDTKYPCFSQKTGGSSLEQTADEVEEYANLLPVEYALETKLKDINLALDKIKKNKYGICEICNKKISLERLEVIPSARTCINCQKN